MGLSLTQPLDLPARFAGAEAAELPPPRLPASQQGWILAVTQPLDYLKAEQRPCMASTVQRPLAV